MPTPYVTPQMLVNAPTGISWDTIPDPKATESAKIAEQTNIAWRAHGMVDTYCNQPLRATVDAEQLYGPGDMRVQTDQQGIVHILLSRWPVTSIVSAKYSLAASFPRQWQTIPVDQFDFDEALLPAVGSSAPGASAVGPSGVYLAPGYIDWRGGGRRGYTLQLTYTNGWPHAGITSDAAVGATSLAVDDVTGFAGADSMIYDGGSTEDILVSAIQGGVTTGPGTLTLATPLQYAHQATDPSGALISALPPTIQQATILFACYLALVRGATATTVPLMPGGEEHQGAPDFATEAEILLAPFKRVL